MSHNNNSSNSNNSNNSNNVQPDPPFWAREFGAAWQVPEVIAKDPDLSDQSWHNDAMPIFCLLKDREKSSSEGVIRLSCDHIDRAGSEFSNEPGDYQRFHVWRDHTMGADYTPADNLYDGNDAVEAVAVLKREGAKTS